MAYYVVLGQSKMPNEDQCKHERCDGTKSLHDARNLVTDLRAKYPKWTFWIDKIED